MENLDLVYSLFNQYIFQEAKNNIEHVEYYFQTNPNTMANPLVSELVYAIKTYQFESIGLPLFNGILAKCGKSRQEGEKILSEITKWKTYSKEQVLPAKKFLQDLCASAVLRRAGQLYSQDPVEYLKYLKNTNFKTVELDILNSLSFSDLDINSIIADESTGGIPSHYSWLNESFEPTYKIDKGQMIMVSMPPGCGKSLFAMSEAMHMAIKGYKVHYLAMGDLNMKDFVIRLGAMWSGMSFADTRENIGNIYRGLSSQLGNNLGITIVPAGSTTVEDYIEFIKDQPYDCLFIDYDSNFKSNASDNMYSEYGDIYEKLTKLTGMGKIIYILAQPKVGVWQNERIEQQDIGESSRKQHSCDVIITRGRAENPNHLGIFKIVKNRRGEVGIVDYSIRLQNGRFRSIPKEIYLQLKESLEKRNYTDADIDGMVSMFNNNTSRVNNYVNNANNSGNNNSAFGLGNSTAKGLSPF